MNRPKPTKKQLMQVWEMVTKFVDDNHLSEPSAYHQNDRAQVRSYDFIEDLAEMVGFYQYPNDDK